MKCFLYSNDELMGWADLQIADPTMGFVCGEFNPSENYQKIEPVVRAVLLNNGTLGELNERKLKVAFAERDQLNLRLRTDSNIELEPSVIYLSDFTSEAPDLEIELEAGGLHWQVLRDVFGYLPVAE